MNEVGTRFREWILSLRVQGAKPVQLDEDRISIELPTATAEVNFYPYEDDKEIVEYRVVREDGDASFFLHFELDDLQRAQELFGQMEESLAEESSRETTHVLLSCTSALTTTLFAQRMNEVAQTLGLDYDFCAKPVDEALTTSEPFSAVLLAPQAAHTRKRMMESHPNALVFEIPAKIFGSFDAAGAVRLLMHAFREVSERADVENGLRAVRDLHDDKRVLTITLFALRDHMRLGYRLYDKGEAVVEGAVRKSMDMSSGYDDIEGLIRGLSVRELDLSTLDAIAIAVPGVTLRGKVSLPGIIVGEYDLGPALFERFGVPVYVDNNCNAAAVGCYVSQDECENLMFYRHAFGHVAGGMGTVIDGKLLKGHGNFAGEPKYFEDHFALDMSYEDTLWSAEGMHELALNVAVASAAVVAPDALYLAVDTIDDASAFHDELARILGRPNAPKVVIVDDYVERVYLGTLALALQKLHDPKYRSLGVGFWA